MCLIWNRALSVYGLECAVEYRQILRLDVRGALNGVVLINVTQDDINLVLGVAEAGQGRAQRAVDDFHHA